MRNSIHFRLVFSRGITPCCTFHRIRHWTWHWTFLNASAIILKLFKLKWSMKWTLYEEIISNSKRDAASKTRATDSVYLALQDFGDRRLDLHGSRWNRSLLKQTREEKTSRDNIWGISFRENGRTCWKGTVITSCSRRENQNHRYGKWNNSEIFQKAGASARV